MIQSVTVCFQEQRCKPKIFFLKRSPLHIGENGSVQMHRFYLWLVELGQSSHVVAKKLWHTARNIVMVFCFVFRIPLKGGVVVGFLNQWF